MKESLKALTSLDVSTVETNREFHDFEPLGENGKLHSSIALSKFVENFTMHLRNYINRAQVAHRTYMKEVKKISNFTYPYGYASGDTLPKFTDSVIPEQIRSAIAKYLSIMFPTTHPLVKVEIGAEAEFNNRKQNLSSQNKELSKSQQEQETLARVEKADVLNDMIHHHLSQSNIRTVMGGVFEDLLFGVASLYVDISKDKITFEQIALPLFMVSPSSDPQSFYCRERPIEMTNILKSYKKARLSKETLEKLHTEGALQFDTPSQNTLTDRPYEGANIFDIILSQSLYIELIKDSLLDLTPEEIEDIERHLELDLSDLEMRTATPVDDERLKRVLDYLKVIGGTAGSIKNSKEGYIRVVLYPDTQDIILCESVLINPYIVFSWGTTSPVNNFYPYTQGLLFSAYPSLKYRDHLLVEQMSSLRLRTNPIVAASSGVFDELRKLSTELTNAYANSEASDIADKNKVDASKSVMTRIIMKEAGNLEARPFDVLQLPALGEDLVMTLKTQEQIIAKLLGVDEMGTISDSVRSATEIAYRRDEVSAKFGVESLQLYQELQIKIVQFIVVFLINSKKVTPEHFPDLWENPLTYTSVTPLSNSVQQQESTELVRSFQTLQQLVSPEILYKTVDQEKLIKEYLSLVGGGSFIRPTEDQDRIKDEFVESQQKMQQPGAGTDQAPGVGNF